MAFMTIKNKAYNILTSTYTITSQSNSKSFTNKFNIYCKFGTQIIETKAAVLKGTFNLRNAPQMKGSSCHLQIFLACGCTCKYGINHIMYNQQLGKMLALRTMEYQKSSSYILK